MDKQAAVKLRNVSKVFGDKNSGVTALHDVSIDFQQHTFTAVMGPSGSGKSTLLYCATGLERPSSGSVSLNGLDLQEMSETALDKMRRKQVGFVFQLFNLLPALNVTQNVTLPLLLAHKHADRQAVREILSRVGLEDRRHAMPHQLSGGQQQRVAIARALVAQPAVIFADEPTGALDTRTALEVLRLLREVVEQANQTVVMVTHDPVAASHADRVVFLADGQIVETLEHPSSEVIAERMTRLGAWDKKTARSLGRTVAEAA
jgi:putative ABC transport system ATP-binding protein